MGCKFSRNRSPRKKAITSSPNQGNERNVQGGARSGDGEESFPFIAADVRNKLVHAGIDEKLAEEIAKKSEKGELKSTSAIASVLEKNDSKYYIHLKDKILVRVNSAGELVCKTFENGANENVTKETNATGRININTASRHSLEEVKGIGPVLAGRIVQYREEHGLFTSVNDLISVRGVSDKLLEKIRSHLTVKSTENGHKKESKTRKITKWTRNSKTVRLATWNLLSFSCDKANNDGVREVICRTVLENGIDILAVQEIGDNTALQKIRDELNNPTIATVKELAGAHDQWECQTSDVAGYMFRSKEYNGFLWNKSAGIELKSDSLLEQPKKGGKQFARRPYLGFFKAKKFDFVLVSVHLKATGLGNADIERLQKELARISDLTEVLKTHLADEKDTMILGDFNLGPDEDEFDPMRSSSLFNVIPGSTFTNISLKNMEGSKNYDNIWISKHTKLHHFTGKTGVVRHGLTHPSIPDGWGWNGLVSDHCPVLAEFYCDRDLDETPERLDVHGIHIDSK